jgi:hypothetical protein
MDRYFVTVYARTADDLRRLQKYGLDLFAPTARQDATRAEFAFSIEGLVSIADIETLVKEGYRVLVEEPMAARTQASRQTMEFGDWLATMQAPIALDQSIRK